MLRSTTAFLFFLLLAPATASAVPISHELDVTRVIGPDPDGLVERDVTVTRIEHVAPEDVDDDGVADSVDSCIGTCVEVGGVDSVEARVPGASVPPPALDPSTGTPYVDPTCESGGSGGYAADTGNGFFGAYQFDQSTWDAYAPEGYDGMNPATAPAAVQDAAAAAVPYDAWPNC